MIKSQFTGIIETEAPPLRLAVLIDADNAQVTIIGNLLQEIATLGQIIIKRIYGDFTIPNNSCWPKIIQKFAIKPIHQFSYTYRKNSTDICMVIDAMDLLHTQPLDGFCLVSSDSDFTGLAIRIREAGLKVYGFGEKKTPLPFQAACNQFTCTEQFRPNSLEHDQPPPPPQTLPITQKNEPPPPPVNLDDELKILLTRAIESIHDDGDWVNLSHIGTYLYRVKPNFRPKHYGHSQLSGLVKLQENWLDIKETHSINNNSTTTSIRLKTP